MIATLATLLVLAAPPDYTWIDTAGNDSAGLEIGTVSSLPGGVAG